LIRARKSLGIYLFRIQDWLGFVLLMEATTTKGTKVHEGCMWRLARGIGVGEMLPWGKCFGFPTAIVSEYRRSGYNH
jgi:hypothetical protein